MQWVASTLHTTSEHGVSSITTPDAHTSAASSRLNWRPPADLNGLANSVGSQYSSHYLGTRCIQHYYRWCAHLGCQQSTGLTPTGRLNGLGPFRAKDEIWFLRVCHHVSTGLCQHKVCEKYWPVKRTNFSLSLSCLYLLQSDASCLLCIPHSQEYDIWCLSPT